MLRLVFSRVSAVRNHPGRFHHTFLSAAARDQLLRCAPRTSALRTSVVSRCDGKDRTIQTEPDAKTSTAPTAGTNQTELTQQSPVEQTTLTQQSPVEEPVEPVREAVVLNTAAECSAELQRVKNGHETSESVKAGSVEPVRPVEPVGEAVAVNAVETSPAETLVQDSQPIKPEPVLTEPVQTKTVTVEPVQIESVMVDPVKMEPVQSEPVQMESVMVDSVKMEPVQSEPVQMESVMVDPVKVELVHMEPVQVEPVPVKPESMNVEPIQTVQTEPVMVDPVKVEPVQMEPVKPEPVKVETVELKPVQSESVKPEPVQVEPVQMEPVMVDPVKVETVQIEPVQLEPVNLEPVETVKPESVKVEPIQCDPVQSEPVKAEPVKAEPVKAEPVKAEPVKAEPVKMEPVKSGKQSLLELLGAMKVEVTTKRKVNLKKNYDSAQNAPPRTPVAMETTISMFQTATKQGAGLSDSSQPSRSELSQSEPSQSDSSSLDPSLVAAATAAAATLPGRRRAESELLKELKKRKDQTEERKKGDVSRLGVLLSEMKVGRAPSRKNASPANQILYDDDGRGYLEERGKTSEQRRRSLFSGRRLNVFSPETDRQMETMEAPPTLWDVDFLHQLTSSTNHLPRNGLEEMIQWSREGKLWAYPVDNEAGLEEEARVSFHQHVFLQHLLQEGFPDLGPVRHFMELVVTGLSKNAFLSVREKEEHIAWFKEYFKEKEEVLKEAQGLQ